MRVALVCLSSSSSAIADSFKDFSDRIADKENFYFVVTRHSLADKVARNGRFRLLKYRRNILAFLSFLPMAVRVRNFVLRNGIHRVFFYSTLPINGLISLFLPKWVDVHLWLHDPIPHSGERRIFIIAKCFDEYLMRFSGRLRKVWLGSESLREQMYGGRLRDAPTEVLSFPYIDQIVSSCVSVSTLNKRAGVIFFGRVEHYKGLDRLMRILIRFSDGFLDKPVIKIVGSGSLDMDLIEDMRSVGYSVFVDNRYIPNADLANQIVRSSVAVFPYLDATATQAIQTAGALGCKIVATNVGGLPEFVLPVGGYVARTDDENDIFAQILNALNDPVDPVAISSCYLKRYDVSLFSTNLAVGLTG